MWEPTVKITHNNHNKGSYCNNYTPSKNPIIGPYNNNNNNNNMKHLF